MRQYEAIIILDPLLSEEKVEQLQEKIKNIINEAQGKINNMENLGKKKLAYPIQGNKDAVYKQINFEAPVSLIAQIDRTLKLSEGVLRHLIVREEK